MIDPLSFIGSGEATRQLRDLDWAALPLGPADAWPASFRILLALVLSSPEAMWFAWGPDRVFFFNDAYVPQRGNKAPGAIGRPFAEVWADVWPFQQPRRFDEKFLIPELSDQLPPRLRARREKVRDRHGVLRRKDTASPSAAFRTPKVMVGRSSADRFEVRVEAMDTKARRYVVGVEDAVMATSCLFALDPYVHAVTLEIREASERPATHPLGMRTKRDYGKLRTVKF